MRRKKEPTIECAELEGLQLTSTCSMKSENIVRHAAAAATPAAAATAAAAHLQRGLRLAYPTLLEPSLPCTYLRLSLSLSPSISVLSVHATSKFEKLSLSRFSKRVLVD